MKKLISTQLIVLICGTLFAWTNFFIELASWLKGQACTTGCAVGVVNPFLTPCFYGAVFFLVSCFLSFLIFVQASNQR
ncbi:MAG: hypothetical protein WCX71_01130 [Candidatus Buchananbacteria bacterium]